MTNRIQSLRSNVAGARPAGQIPGTIYTNFADRQIGVVSPTNAPLDMVAVRFFSTTASYVLGDYVVNGGQIYRAPGPIAPGVFNPGAWVPIGNAMFDQSLNTFDTVRFRSMILGMVGVPGQLSLVREDNVPVARMFELASGTGLGIEQGGGQPILFYTAPGSLTGLNERMRIDAAGNVGIGMTPVNVLDITKNQNAVSTIQLQNSDTGAASYCRSRLLGSSGNACDTLMLGVNYVLNGIYRPGGGVVTCDGPGGLTLNAAVAQPLYFATNSTERMRIDSAGNVGIGMVPGGSALVDIGKNQNNSTHVWLHNTDPGVNNVAQYIVGNGNANAALAHFGVNYNPSSGPFRADGSAVYTPGAGGLTLVTTAAQPIYLGTNSVERMRIDAAGNVGIGMTAPVCRLHVAYPGDNSSIALVSATATAVRIGASVATASIDGVDNTGNASFQPLAISASALSLFSVLAQPMRFSTAGIERMRIDASGNVGIGTANPLRQLHVVANANASTALIIENTNQQPLAETRWQLTTGASLTAGIKFPPTDPSYPDAFMLYDNGAGGMYFRQATAAPIRFLTSDIEKGRFTTNGYFKASNFGTYLFGTSGPTSLKHEFVSDKDGEECLSVTNSYGLNPYGLVVNFSGGTPNNATNYFYRAQDTAGARAYILANGGLSNYAANNSNLSDESVKDYITPYTATELAALEQSFTSVIWGKYKYRDQTHDDWNHGPTAQGVERAFALTAPELVDEGVIGLKSEAGDAKHKVIYETDLAHIGQALLARALTEIKELKAAVALLMGGKPPATA